MKQKQYSLTPPVIPGELVQFVDGFIDDESYGYLEVGARQLAAQTYNSIVIEGSKFQTSVLGGAIFKDCKFTNLRFDGCDAANGRIDKSIFERVEFLKCRMTGFKALECNFRDVLFKDCQMKLSQFRMSTFKNIIFDHCILEEADFYGATMVNVQFIDCELLKSEFSASKLSEVDFRSSKLEGINIAAENLKGAIIDPSQLPSLGHLLGARIEWKKALE